jgi:hypothetical protein
MGGEAGHPTGCVGLWLGWATGRGVEGVVGQEQLWAGNLRNSKVLNFENHRYANLGPIAHSHFQPLLPHTNHNVAVLQTSGRFRFRIIRLRGISPELR